MTEKCLNRDAWPGDSTGQIKGSRSNGVRNIFEVSVRGYYRGSEFT